MLNTVLGSESSLKCSDIEGEIPQWVQGRDLGRQLASKGVDLFWIILLQATEDMMGTSDVVLGCCGMLSSYV